jgi:trigger factor
MSVAGLGGVLETPEMRDKAEREAERLLEELKEKVTASFTDIGTLRKEMRVTVPGEVISNHLKHNFDEIRGDAVLPGFRKGRAPLHLLQKRFGPEVRESLKTSIVGQSFMAAIKKNELDVLGDPLFSIAEKDGGVKLCELGDALEKIKLPDSGDFAYTCEIELKPTFELPELKGIEIEQPKVEIGDEDVDAHIERQRKIRGNYQPLEGGAADKDDLLVADVKLMHEGALVKEEENVQLGVRATRLDGISLMTLEEVLAGAKPGDTRTVECEIADDYERADLRGKKGKFEFKIHEVKRLVPQPMDAYIESLGLGNEAEVREYVKQDLEAERDRIVDNALRDQVLDHLVQNTKFDLPEKLSSRQTDRAVMRRVVELSQAGVPSHEIEARIDELRTSAKDVVARDLKLEFILEKVAEKLEAEVSDEEVNTEIARIARSYNYRFDRVRDDLQKRGLLPQLAEQIRQDKCVRMLLKDAKLVERKAEDAKPKKEAKAAKPVKEIKAAKVEKEPKAEPEKKAKKPTKKKTDKGE